MSNNYDLQITFEMATSQSNDDNKKKAIEELLKQGFLNPTVKCVYDIETEKYHLLFLETQEFKPIDKKETIRNIALQYYEWLPKFWSNLIPTKKLIFDPNEKETFVRNNIPYQNTYIPTKFFLFQQQNSDKKDKIDLEQYPHIKALLENLFVTDDRIDYFINWLAYIIDTRKKAKIAIILRGIQGTGKNVLGDYILKYLFGYKYTYEMTNEDLSSRFNGALENKLFVIGNELKGNFKEGNIIYEKLKTYITDDNIRFEDKNIKARIIRNFFNVMIFSNNDVPLQIQGSDRRYTVYETKNRTLKEVSEIDFKYPHTKFFIEGLIRERDNFLFDVCRYNYDIKRATTADDTEEKERIYLASMTKLEILSDKLKIKDLIYFEHELREIAEIDYESFKDIVKKTGAIPLIAVFDDNEVENKNETINAIVDKITKKIQESFETDRIENSILILLYRLFVDNNITNNTKIGTKLTTHFGKSYVIRNKRYRKISIERIPF